MEHAKRVLIVEDEVQFAKMVKLRLESAGYGVTLATDAYTGTHLIAKNDYDLVILDLAMPAGGGFAVLERMHNFPAKSTIPVIILTGQTVDAELKRRAMEFGVAAVFSKPYDPKTFLRKVKSLAPV